MQGYLFWSFTILSEIIRSEKVNNYIGRTERRKGSKQDCPRLCRLGKAISTKILEFNVLFPGRLRFLTFKNVGIYIFALDWYSKGWWWWWYSGHNICLRSVCRRGRRRISFVLVMDQYINIISSSFIGFLIKYLVGVYSMILFRMHACKLLNWSKVKHLYNSGKQSNLKLSFLHTCVSNWLKLL